MIRGLTVVTHTNPKAGRDISKCIESVKVALPPHSRHVLIDLDADYSEFQEARYAAMALDEIVVMVDDDDYISPDSLKLCLQALNETNAGLAFTYEVMVRTDGTHVCNPRRVSYEMIANHPQIVHQMCAIRTSCVTNRSIDICRKYGIGIEWLMKAESAIFNNAVQIPIKGYYWVQHHKQRHREKSWQDGFRNNLASVSNEIKSWSPSKDLIPLWQNKTT